MKLKGERKKRERQLFFQENENKNYISMFKDN